MQITLKNIFQLSIVAGALALAGCGGDVNIKPTVNDNSTTTSTTTTTNATTDDTPTVVENPCASRGDLQGAFNGTDCEYSTSFASKNVEVENDIEFAKLANDGVHVLNGALLVGKDCDTTTACTIETDGPTLTVQPGATLAFTSGEAIIRIARGAKINAVGTFAEPITFTSANAIERHDAVGNGAQFADWGGIIINGMGITNQCTNAERAASTCNVETEGVTSYFGGNNNADDSGTIQYAKIWYAGSGPKTGGEGDDLNSLTLNGVGSGSSFDYLHIHQGYDDGIEFFGGASTIRHIVVTDTQDDAIDIDGGWQGKGQFIFVKHGSVETKTEVVIPADGNDPERIIPAGSEIYMGNNGFETDGEKNGGDDYNEAPASNPTIANVTVITTDEKSVRDQSSSQAIKFDDAIMSNYYNTLFVKADGTNGTACIEHSSDGEKNADSITFTSSVMACDNEFKGEATFISGKEPTALTGTAKADWFDNAGASQRVAATTTVLSNAFATDVDSADITVTATDVTTLDSFFMSASYVGAVSDADTASNWYQWVEAAVDAAEQD